jgi:hypothetical protein
MSMRRNLLWIPIAATVALVLAVAAPAARAPTPRERQALLQASALARSLARAPAGCVTFDVRVSADGVFGKLEPRFRTAARCSRWASNGYELFRWTPPSWTLIFAGSDPPPCSFGVSRDLTPCLNLPQGSRANFAAAARVVRRLGFQPRPGPWEEELEFNALVAEHGSLVRTFFFQAAKLLGTDSGGRTARTYAWRGDDVIAIRYGTRCPPVRYELESGRLRRLDALSVGSTPPRC